MTAFQKKIDELRVQQKERIEFVHTDLKGQVNYEAQARTAMMAQINEISSRVREATERQESMATKDEVERVRAEG